MPGTLRVPASIVAVEPSTFEMCRSITGLHLHEGLARIEVLYVCLARRGYTT